jgi:hypothetical protein
MPRMSKASFETKAAYRDCVNASGTVGMTVQKVDQGTFSFRSSSFVAEFEKLRQQVSCLVASDQDSIIVRCMTVELSERLFRM